MAPLLDMMAEALNIKMHEQVISDNYEEKECSHIQNFQIEIMDKFLSLPSKIAKLCIKDIGESGANFLTLFKGKIKLISL